jgi:hypothetical protein
MAGALHGRLSRLERSLVPVADATTCGACGLPHAHLPLPMVLVETIVRWALRDRLAEGVGALSPPTRLCLCLECCADGHAIARLSHGLPSGAGAG